ncbi:MAG: allophycocyanin subunit beta [Leptolyngbyaceae cyanobacterium MAG.088]|nr:allophycocyanin subunit beta [Leptolyngbyaceae cyanobacterium MAG.088]
MRDTVTGLISTYDITGRYLDRDAIDSLRSYFESGTDRIKAAAYISANASSLVKATGAALYERVPELLRPGGNSYTTRRYAACLRDLDYYLRYSSYALVAGNCDVLTERVLNGLRETYNSLEVPVGPTVISIQIMKDVVKEELTSQGIGDVSFIDAPFDHLARELGEVSV